MRAGAPVDDAGRLIEAARALAGVVRVSGVLLRSGRVVDLNGLQDSIGVLSARALELDPPGRARLRPHLASLLADVNRLDAVLRDRQRLLSG
jgi:hypothetical protein